MIKLKCVSGNDRLFIIDSLGIKIRDGGASGTVLLDLATTNGGSKQCDFSHTPFRCSTDIYVELSTITSCTVVYN